MWRRGWRSALLWERLPDVQSSGRLLIREISLFCWEDVLDEMESAVPLVLLRCTRKLRSRYVALRCRREMLRLSARFRGCSVEKKSAD